MANQERTRSPFNRQVLAGERFGRWIVLEDDEPGSKKRQRVKCICDCGKNKTVYAVNLLNGKTLSCGCRQRELASTHGMTNSREYRSWRGMIRRCYRSREHEKWYASRGVVVCQRWRDSFSAFLEDVGRIPSVGRFTLDRIDNNGNYEKGNVRWATDKQQARNKRTNIVITAFGKTRLLVEWAEVSGLPRNAIKMRLQYGWKTEDAVSLPLSHVPYARRRSAKNEDS